ncbi:MAG: YqeG family HAD IIIA-type phosphatase [Coriobacteriales bacterium]|jgi:HAD superfamily phosphatase (TIGR01668 family)
MGEVRRLAPGIVPDEHVPSVCAIDPSRLVGLGIQAVLLDLDNTLLPRGQEDIPERAIAWVGALKQADLKVALLTNSARFAVAKAADALDLPLEDNAFKPFTAGYRHLLFRLDVAPEHAVMVGDQSYTDILGAHRAGIRAIMVDPLSHDDPPHTKVLRLVDAWAIRRADSNMLS